MSGATDRMPSPLLWAGRTPPKVERDPAKKAETPLDGDDAGGRCFRRRSRRVASAAWRWHARRTSASRVRCRRRPRCVKPVSCVPSRGTAQRTGRFLEGLASRCHDVTGHVAWSGSRTRDTRINHPMLYPTELSSGGRTGFEPVANGMRRCSASELSSARSTVLHLPAYATAAPRAPDGTQAHAAGMVSIDAPHCRHANAGNRCERNALVSLFLPCAARVEASQRSADAPLAAAPLPRGARALPGCFRAEKAFRAGREPTWSMHAHPPRTPETKRPRVVRPEGVRVPREIGAADLPGSQPDVRCRCAVRVRHHARQTHARAVAHCSARAAAQTVWRWRRRASWQNRMKSRDGGITAIGRRSRTIRALLRACNTFF